MDSSGSRQRRGTDTPHGNRALTRDVPSTFEQAITPHTPAAPIDVALAQEQHSRYCEALESLGLSLTRIEADDRYPDCCFVEDTALVIGERAIIAAPGAESRRGETAAVEEQLRAYKELHHIREPATLDGGDVLRIDDTLYVGLTQRTNAHAADQLREILSNDGYAIRPVEVSGILHLKSASTHLGGDTIVYLPGHVAETVFAGYRRITVPPHEAHAANCLSINGVVLLPAGAPETRARIEEAGYETLEVNISESHKAGGGLTCSSIIF